MFKTITHFTAAATLASLGVAAAATIPSSASASAPSLPATCQPVQLSASLTPGSPGMGQRYATLTLTNRSAASCRTGGFVGLALTQNNDQLVPTHAVRDNIAGARTIVLSPGASASTLLHWDVVPSPGDNVGPCRTAPTHLEVTPPNDYSWLYLPWNMGTVCQQGTIDATPLTPGRQVTP